MTRRILLVDDEPALTSGLARTLRAEQPEWDIHAVDSAGSALRCLGRELVDVVISDVAMPGMDGFALLQELKSSKLTRDIPVIILTGTDDTTNKRRAIELGAVDLLNKPVNLQDLIARVNSALRLKDYQDLLCAQNAQLERMVAQRTAELEYSRLDIIWKLGKAGEYRDELTGNHVVRVGCYARILAEALGFDTRRAEELYIAAPLHDIGKIGIPDEILRKPGRLDTYEMRIMQQHCEIGQRILSEGSKVMRTHYDQYAALIPELPAVPENPILHLAASISLGHHEWWNGTGYPAGLSGEDIPITSRIVALADTYDALRSVRPYKPAFSEERTVGIIRSESGTHLDPTLCEIFEHVAPELARIHEELTDVEEPVKECAR